MNNIINLKEYQESKRDRQLLKDQEEMLQGFLKAASMLKPWAFKYSIAFDTLLVIQKSCIVIQNSISSLKTRIRNNGKT